jgi:hypothetical protein
MFWWRGDFRWWNSLDDQIRWDDSSDHLSEPSSEAQHLADIKLNQSQTDVLRWSNIS